MLIMHNDAIELILAFNFILKIQDIIPILVNSFPNVSVS